MFLHEPHGHIYSDTCHVKVIRMVTLTSTSLSLALIIHTLPYISSLSKLTGCIVCIPKTDRLHCLYPHHRLWSHV